MFMAAPLLMVRQFAQVNAKHPALSGHAPFTKSPITMIWPRNMQVQPGCSSRHARRCGFLNACCWYTALGALLIGGHQRVGVVEQDFELAFAKDNEDELGTRDPKFEYYGSLALLSLSLMTFVPGTFTRSESRGVPGCGRG